VQVARAVHALDADQLDVAGGGRPGDQRVRARRIEDGERVRQVGDDLVGADHDQVEVGHQGERAAPLTRAVVEDDGAGFRDRDRAAGQHPGDIIELAYRQRGIAQQFHRRGHQRNPFRR
jgi:hypothetical protein